MVPRSLQIGFADAMQPKERAVGSPAANLWADGVAEIRSGGVIVIPPGFPLTRTARIDSLQAFQCGFRSAQ
jgi:hypothetical protein